MGRDCEVSDAGWRRRKTHFVVPVPRSPRSTGSKLNGGFTTAGLSAAGSLPLSAALRVVERRREVAGVVCRRVGMGQCHTFIGRVGY
jgi:hypothetical protein